MKKAILTILILFTMAAAFAGQKDVFFEKDLGDGKMLVMLGDPYRFEAYIVDATEWKSGSYRVTTYVAITFSRFSPLDDAKNLAGYEAVSTNVYAWMEAHKNLKEEWYTFDEEPIVDRNGETRRTKHSTTEAVYYTVPHAY